MNEQKLLTELTTDENREVIRAFTMFAGDAVTVAEVPQLLKTFGQWAVANRIGQRPDGMAAAIAAIIRLEPMPRLTLKPPAPPKRKKPREPRRQRSPRLPKFHLDCSPGTLWHLFKTSYKLRELRGGSQQTDKQYEIQLRHFGRYLGHQPTLADLHEDTITAFLDEHARGRTPCTVNKAHWALIALWQHAAKKRLAETFPTIAPLREPERVPQAWTINELARLLESCRRQIGTIAGVNAADWWFALCLFAFTTGERTGAVLSIRLSDVNFERGEVLVPAEVRKGRKRDMLYRLRPETLEAISRIREPERKLLFAFDADISTFYNRFGRILRRAGLPHYKCKLQKLRRTFASYVEAAGGDATKALAHSNRSIAIKSYLDPRVCGGRNPSDLLPTIPLAESEGAA